MRDHHRVTVNTRRLLFIDFDYYVVTGYLDDVEDRYSLITEFVLFILMIQFAPHDLAP